MPVDFASLKSLEAELIRNYFDTFGTNESMRIKKQVEALQHAIEILEKVNKEDKVPALLKARPGYIHIEPNY